MTACHNLDNPWLIFSVCYPWPVPCTPSLAMIRTVFFIIVIAMSAAGCTAGDELNVRSGNGNSADTAASPTPTADPEASPTPTPTASATPTPTPTPSPSAKVTKYPILLHHGFLGSDTVGSFT